MNFFKEEGYTPSKKIGIMDAKQLAALALALGFAVIMSKVFDKLSAEGAAALLFRLSSINLFLIAARIANYVFILKNFKADYSLPLHYCSFNVLLCFLAMASKSGALTDFIYTMSPLPALFALLSPESDAAKYPRITSFRSLEYYTSHTLLILVPLFAEKYTDFAPSMSYAGICAVIFTVMLLIASLANRMSGGNYMYIARAPHGTPLTIVEDKLGKFGYRAALIGFFAVLYIAIHMVYGLLG